MLPNNNMQTKKPSKREKVQNKMFFCRAKTSFSCKNDPKKALFFCQYVFPGRPSAGWTLMASDLQEFMKLHQNQKISTQSPSAASHNQKR